MKVTPKERNSKGEEIKAKRKLENEQFKRRARRGIEKEQLLQPHPLCGSQGLIHTICSPPSDQRFFALIPRCISQMETGRLGTVVSSSKNTQ